MKVLCILYDDPKGGMPKSYPLSKLPKIEKYPDGMTLPSPKGRDYSPGQLLGCVSGELGLRKFLESNGHEYVVTNSKDGDGCEADKHICLLYTSDAADEGLGVDLGGRRIIKKPI